MQEYKNLLTKLFNYIDKQQDWIKTKDNINIYYILENFEYIKDKLLEEYNKAIDCGSKSALKEMIDTISQIKRNMDIRLKNWNDFRLDNIIRLEGVRRQISDKNDLLNQQIGKG